MSGRFFAGGSYSSSGEYELGDDEVLVSKTRREYGERVLHTRWCYKIDDTGKNMRPMEREKAEKLSGGDTRECKICTGEYEPHGVSGRPDSVKRAIERLRDDDAE